MTTSFPGSLDSFVNPTASDTLDSATVPHAAQHDNLNDAVKAVETALGANLVNVAQIASANTFTTSPQQINGAASAVGLIVKANATTPGDIQQWQNSAGTALSVITSGGAFTGLVRYPGGSASAFGTAAVAGTMLTLSTFSTTNLGLVIKGVASQTADLFQYQNSAATVLSGVNAAGQIYAGTTASKVGSTTTALTSAAYTSATVAVFTYGGTSLVQAGQTVTVAGVSGGTYNGTWVVSAVTSTTFTVLGSGFTNVAGSGGTVKLSAVGSFVAGTAAITPLIVQAAASPTANLQEWQDSTGAVLASVSSNGNVSVNAIQAVANSYVGSRFTVGTPSILSNGIFTVRPINATQVVSFIQGVTNQTADLTQWGTIAGTVIGGRNALAQIYTGSTSPILVATGGATTAASGDGTTATITTTSAHGLAVGDLVTVAGVTPTGYNATALITAVGTTTTFSYLNATSGAQTVAGTVSAPAQSSVTARSAGTVGLVVNTAASPTADALRVQIAGTNALRVSNSGSIIVGAVYATSINDTSATGGYLNPTSTSLQLRTRSATNSIVVLGAASQTANLQEWQDSAATVLAKITSAGIIYGAQVRTTSSLALLTEASSGGAITLFRPTTTLSNPGANTARLYFRDGTTAGTLKLVVIAGAAGAETTILDNIPQ